MTTIVDGTTGITYPTIAGGTSAVQASSSKVLQVVTGTTSTTLSATTATAITTGLTASITPSSTANKIMIQVAQTFYLTAAGAQTNFVLYKGASSISNLGQLYGSVIETTLPGLYIDSPATTSSVTYTTYFNNNTTTGTVYVQQNSIPGIIILMEIAG